MNILLLKWQFISLNNFVFELIVTLLFLTSGLSSKNETFLFYCFKSKIANRSYLSLLVQKMCTVALNPHEGNQV
jgi:hypothetical protein